MTMTGGSAGPGGDGFHTGSLNPGTGGVRDTYDPDEGATWSQAEYAERTAEDVYGRRNSLARRIYTKLRSLVQGY